MKKITALLLAIVTLLCTLTFTSCNDASAPTKPTGVFRETTIELPEELQSDNVNFQSFHRAGDNLYILVYSYDPETYMPNYNVACYDLVNNVFGESFDVPLPENSENSGANLNSFTVSEDGTVYFAIEKYSFGEDEYKTEMELIVLKDGETRSVPVSLEGDDQYGFYVNSMAALSDGSVMLASWNGLRLLTKDGEVKPVEFDSEQNSVENMFILDGQLHVSIYGYDGENYGTKIYPFDPATGEFGEPLSVKTQHTYNMILGPGYDYYYNDRNVLWGVDIETGEMTEVVNFINSDLNGNDVRQILPLSKDRFFITSRQRTNTRTMSTLGFIDRVPEHEIVEKKMLRLAVTYAAYDLRSSVIAFNKANDTYRITIDDYSRFNTDENYNAGIDKLTSDILTGDVPDIFMLTTEMPYDVYAARGVFADIYKLMDADPDFRREDYLENVFEAYEYNGELLSLIPSFYITTFAAKKELLGDIEGWTFEEFMSFAAAHPDMTMFDNDFNRTNFVEMFMLFARDSFIDSETGTCRFDSDEFRRVLEFIKTLSDVSFWDTVENEDAQFWQEYENRFKENRVLLASASLYDLSYSFKNLLNYTFGAEVAFVGFPVSEGNGALILADYEYAIAEDSEFKEGAWQFLKTMIAPENQMPYYNEEYKSWSYPVNSIPVLREALDKMIEIAMTPPEENKDSVVIGGAVTLPSRPVAVVTEAAVAVASSEVAVTVVEVDEPTVEVTVEGDSDETVEGEETAEVEADEAEDVEAEDVEIEAVTEEPMPDVDIAVDYIDPYLTPITKEQADTLVKLITNTTSVARYDNDMNEIIKEELEPFFQGQQSLDDTVKHIQSRVSIYINEKR